MTALIIIFGNSGEKHTMGFFDPAGFDPVARKYSFDQMIFNILNEQVAFHYNQNVFVNEMVTFALSNAVRHITFFFT